MQIVRCGSQINIEGVGGETFGYMKKKIEQCIRVAINYSNVFL